MWDVLTGFVTGKSGPDHEQRQSPEHEMASAEQQYPPEFAFLRQLPPADLRQWVVSHSTLAANQIEAERDRPPEAG